MNEHALRSFHAIAYKPPPTCYSAPAGADMRGTNIKFGEDKEPHTAAEEFVHALTHGIGAVLASIALVFLVLKVAGLNNTTAVLSVSIYAACVVLLYVASTLYHGFHLRPQQPFFKLLDHSAIYFKIAGTYTPLVVITLQTTLAIWILIGVWVAAIIGTAMKLFAYLRKAGKEHWLLSLSVYLAMGWSGIFMLKPLYEQMPGGLAWIVAGGLCFTVGTIFYAIRSVRYMHAVWHVFVMAGSACHFVAVYFYVL